MVNAVLLNYVNGDRKSSESKGKRGWMSRSSITLYTRGK